MTGRFIDKLFDLAFSWLVERWRSRRDLSIRHAGGSSSNQQGIGYPVIVRNSGPKKMWDLDLTALLDGQEVDRKTIGQVGPESEEHETLRISSALCELRQGVGQVPRGTVTFELWKGSRRVARCGLA